ncbi:MAG: hypothetical protein ACOYK8_00430 [Alphaproteobacteria bacterium]
MVKRYAIFDDAGLVMNVVLWNGDNAIWQPPQGCSALELSDNDFVGIGFSYINGQFIAPEG